MPLTEQGTFITEHGNEYGFLIEGQVCTDHAYLLSLCPKNENGKIDIKRLPNFPRMTRCRSCKDFYSDFDPRLRYTESRMACCEPCAKEMDMFDPEGNIKIERKGSQVVVELPDNYKGASMEHIKPAYQRDLKAWPRKARNVYLLDMTDGDRSICTQMCCAMVNHQKLNKVGCLYVDWTEDFRACNRNYPEYGQQYEDKYLRCKYLVIDRMPQDVGLSSTKQIYQYCRMMSQVLHKRSGRSDRHTLIVMQPGTINVPDEMLKLILGNWHRIDVKGDAIK